MVQCCGDGGGDLVALQVRDRELYEACDTEVKRQIWKDSQALFGDEVSPLLTGYITSKEDTLFNVENLNNLFFSPSPKVKDQSYGKVIYRPYIPCY